MKQEVENILSMNDFGEDAYVVLLEPEDHSDILYALQKRKLLEIRSVSFSHTGVCAYLIQRTPKGKQALHDWWDSSRHKEQQRKRAIRQERFFQKHKYDPPESGKILFGIRMIFPKDGVEIDGGMKFDCENRAVDYFNGEITARQVRRAFTTRKNKKYECVIQCINGRRI